MYLKATIDFSTQLCKTPLGPSINYVVSVECGGPGKGEGGRPKDILLH